VTVLAPPTWGVVVSPGGQFLGPWVALDPLANILRVTFSNESPIAGNSALLGWFFYNTTPAWNGSETLLGTQVFGATGAPYVWDHPASVVPAGDYWSVLWTNNQPTSTNGLYTELSDDVGFSSSSWSGGFGCCHDPMLDEILAAVRYSFPSTS